MTAHYHLTFEHVLVYGISAIIVINLLRIIAVQLGKQEGPVGTVGQSLGGLVHFA